MASVYYKVQIILYNPRASNSSSGEGNVRESFAGYLNVTETYCKMFALTAQGVRTDVYHCNTYNKFLIGGSRIT